MKIRGAKLSLVCGAVLLSAFALIHAVPAHSYLPMGSGSGGVFTEAHWAITPIPVQISSNIAPGSKLQGNTAFATVIQNSLATWAAAPNFSDPIGSAIIVNVTGPNGANLICFCTTGGVFNQNDGTLAVTITQSSGTNITAASIFFNPQPTGVCFVTDSSVNSCTNGGDFMQDLQTVATHELGHFIGLDHSAVVRATMYPFAPTKETQLSWDDVAGASLLYPKPSADVGTGAISGNVTKGGAVFGAHVFANPNGSNNPFGAFPNIRKTPIGTLTDTSGNYLIAGLPPDTYNVYAEPLDGPVTDSNVEWALDWGLGSVSTNFTTRFH
jgi:matrixin